ncbi:MAG: lamin tail domain-containing protein [Candidatus Latescibacteria bacterium]|nr:lamin tail domain-containing protein [Candidatus Latescibacterota bacterium]
MCNRQSRLQYLLPVLLSILCFPTATPAAVVIDEILADPPPGITGDANQDGTRKTYEDEFIEIYNTGPDTVSLMGWRLGDDDTSLASLFTFPDSTKLPPGDRLLLFGGGTPTGFSVPAFADDGRIGNGLTNSGDVLLLLNAAGDTVDTASLASWPNNQSVVRVPAGSGALMPHKTAAPNGTAFSPGYAIADPTTPTDTSGTSPTPATPPTAPEPPSQSPRSKTSHPIVISEILADPPSSPFGDANQDGRLNTYEDEFIELYNSGLVPISLAGWRLSDDDVKTDAGFHFPPDALLPPDSYIVLFGGGQPTGFTVAVFTDDGRIGNGLTNSGDRVLLLNAKADTVLDYTFTSKSNLNQSLVRHDQIYRPHTALPGRGLFSPGRAQTQYNTFAIADPELKEGQTRNLVLVGTHPTGMDTLDASDFQWLSVAPAIAEIRTRARIKGLRPGHTRIECWLDTLFLAQRQIRVAPIEPHNTPPSITSTPDTTAFANGWYRYHVDATDPDHNTLVFTFAQAPAWLKLDYHSGLIQGRTPDTTGSFAIAFEAADGRGGIAAQYYDFDLQPRPQIHIDEVLSDPPAGISGDANNDGHRHAYEDEFVEPLNADQTSVDLSDCGLSDGDGKTFAFPAETFLPPGVRAVVFGGGTPSGAFTFSAGGRIGDGLGNRRDELYLLDPQGLDTLAQLTYDLPRDPDQSIVDRGQTLHTAWPGRMPFSPGTARPLLHSLRPLQHKLNLVQGEKRHLRLIGQYTDGYEYPISNPAVWTSSDTALAIISNKLVLTAIDTGACLLFVRLDSFAINPDTIIVQIRPSLPASLRFTPTWRDSFIANQAIAFIVRSDHPNRQAYIWSLNGQRQPVMSPQFVHTSTGHFADTIRVEIRRGFEKIIRQLVLHASSAIAKRPTDRQQAPLQIWPNPFNANTSIRFQQTNAGPVHLALYNLQGQRVCTLVDEILDTGFHHITWHSQDQHGRSAATGLYFARLTTPTLQAHAKFLLLR